MSRDHFSEAAEAVKKEHRRACQANELICRSVTPIDDVKKIYKLQVGSFSDLSWAWEGARAYQLRPEDEGGSLWWSGEIVEVNKDDCILYVHLDSPNPPITGPFLARPFDFLRALNDVYNGPESEHLTELISEALPCSLGEGKHESIPPGPCLPGLEQCYSSSWGVIWGPPGTGKTWTIGHQVAESSPRSGARTLVISTTNRATDGVAVSIGRGYKQRAISLDGITRVGTGGNSATFEAEGLQSILPPSQDSLRKLLARLLRDRERAETDEERAELQLRIQETRRELKVGSPFLDPEVRVVICTLHYAMNQLSGEVIVPGLAAGRAPFETVIVDEAGMVPRAAVAALSLLASKRFVQVGDPRQLAPISQMSRLIPVQQGRWIGESGLAHLRPEIMSPANVHVLDAQWRMSPEIRKVVSGYQYGGKLKDAPSRVETRFRRDAPLDQVSSAIWYILDEENVPLAHVRAQRGPGNRSWTRRVSLRVLERIWKAHPGLQDADVLYLSPFTAQARLVRQHFAKNQYRTWRAGSVHSQQGAEADVVIVDTVNASSTAWPFDEWKRLINVAISRARSQLILLASRDEMDQPYMSSLQKSLKPMRLTGSGGVYQWIEIPPRSTHDASARVRETGEGLGSQIEARAHMRPILSSEQQQLCERELDDKPRLVRGVAGSGKTVVLAHWVVQTLAREKAQHERIWVLHGNQALRGLLQSLIESAWNRKFPLLELPWERLEFLHVKEVLEKLLSELGLSTGRDFQYEEWASECLGCLGNGRLSPRCDVLFIDEAQDLGHETLRLLTHLVRPRGEDQNARSILLFYDNAQNVFGRSTPRWSDFGLEMRGRSTIMKESFRSTRPISEFATNVLYRLWDPKKDPDLKELIDQDLVEPLQRNGRIWYGIRFNQLEGPLPEYQVFVTEEQELQTLAYQVRHLILEEGVRPRDIKILCNQPGFRERVQRALEQGLQGSGTHVESRASSGCSRQEHVLSISTAHSFKGYEAEIVIVPGVGRFCARESGVLHHALYVALTRARSILWVSGSTESPGTSGHRILEAVRTSWEDQGERNGVVHAETPVERLHGLILEVGSTHEQWLRDLSSAYLLHEEPIVSPEGALLAEPLFWIQKDGAAYVCFGKTLPPSAVRDRLEDHGYILLELGDNL